MLYIPPREKTTDGLNEGFTIGSLVYAQSIVYLPYLLRKEVIQPLVPQRLPCYDFIPITTHTLGRRCRTSGADGFHDVTGGVYKARERIHGAVADAPLLANPTSRGRVADPDLN